MADVYKNFINGKWIETKSGKTFKNINPANTEDVVGIFPSSDEKDVNKAVESARKAWEMWRKVPAPKRGAILEKACKLLIDRKNEIAKLMTREMGKILMETQGDIQEGIDTAFYMAGEGRRLFGQTTPSELNDKFCMSIRIPMGVAGVISPWNFPMAIPCWKIMPALICGDTVVFKPASDAPASGAKLIEVLEEAGIPEGVVNLVHGTGKSVGIPMCNHPNINLITFTGSSQVGSEIASVCGKTLKRVSLEMGGKNAQIVMDDADLDLALEGAIWGAYGTTGQRCTATSRLIIHKKIAKEFIKMFVERASKIKIGDGLKPGTEMGPVINEGQLKTIHQYVIIGKDEDKAELALGGDFYTKGECAKGFFYQPTVFIKCHRKMRIAREEIFGPVLTIIEVKDLDDAIEVLNDTNYGLSSSIYTRDVNKAFKAIRDIYAGITYINGPTIGAEMHMPFGGTKHTGNGHRESGTEVLNTFSEWKTIYVDYSGKLQKAQIDTYKE